MQRLNRVQMFRILNEPKYIINHYFDPVGTRVLPGVSLSHIIDMVANAWIGGDTHGAYDNNTVYYMFNDSNWKDISEDKKRTLLMDKGVAQGIMENRWTMQNPLKMHNPYQGDILFYRDNHGIFHIKETIKKERMRIDAKL
jgi:hypothetical protein